MSQSQSLVINNQNFTRTKKRLKKSLQKIGISLPLSRVGEVLSESLGFKNNFDLQRKEFLDENMIIAKSYLDNIIFIYEEICKYINYDLPKINLLLKKSEKNSKIEEDYSEVIRIVSLKIIYLKENYNTILEEGFIEIKNLDLFSAIQRISFFKLRSDMLLLYKCTGRSVYRIFSEIMDDYHNIESYYLKNNDQRRNFWLQPTLEYKKNNKVYFPDLKIMEKIKFNLSNVVNEITDDNIQVLFSILSMNKNIIIMGEDGFCKKNITDIIAKNNSEHNKNIKIIDKLDDINKTKDAKVLYVISKNYLAGLKKLTAKNFDFNNVGIIVDIMKAIDGRPLYRVAYNSDFEKEKLCRTLKCIKSSYYNLS